jgi:hypothetical protein
MPPTPDELEELRRRVSIERWRRQTRSPRYLDANYRRLTNRLLEACAAAPDRMVEGPDGVRFEPNPLCDATEEERDRAVGEILREIEEYLEEPMA